MDLLKSTTDRKETISNYFVLIPIDSLVIPNGKPLDLKAY